MPGSLTVPDSTTVRAWDIDSGNFGSRKTEQGCLLRACRSNVSVLPFRFIFSLIFRFSLVVIRCFTVHFVIVFSNTSYIGGRLSLSLYLFDLFYFLGGLNKGGTVR